MRRGGASSQHRAGVLPSPWGGRAVRGGRPTRTERGGDRWQGCRSRSAWLTPPATQYYLYNRIIATPCAVLQPRLNSINTRRESGRGGRPAGGPTDLQREKDTGAAGCQLAALPTERPAGNRSRSVGPTRCHRLHTLQW